LRRWKCWEKKKHSKGFSKRSSESHNFSLEFYCDLVVLNPIYSSKTEDSS